MSHSLFLRRFVSIVAKDCTQRFLQLLVGEIGGGVLIRSESCVRRYGVFGAKPFETRAGALVAVLCFRIRDAARSQHDSPNNSRSADPARDTARAQDEGVRWSVGSALSAVTATLKRASQALAFLLIPRCARAFSFSFSASLRPPC